MERPQVNPQPIERNVTGEIMYLDEMRRLGQAPARYSELSDMAIQMYEVEADMTPHGSRPDILDELEKHDRLPTPVVASCHELAAELHKLKDPESHLTFVDIALPTPGAEVLAKLQSIEAGSYLAADDEQLALESNGEYHPILDIKKQNARFMGASLRVWQWEDDKYVFTNGKDEPYDYHKHYLPYPENEKSYRREIELAFQYHDKTAGTFTESLSLHLGPYDQVRMATSVFALAYAETGYEGHHHKTIEVFDEAIAEFGDLVAEIVGDEPESVAQQEDRMLGRFVESLATAEAQQVARDILEATWPTQTLHILSQTPEGSSATIAQLLQNESTIDQGVAALRAVLEDWQVKR